MRRARSELVRDLDNVANAVHRQRFHADLGTAHIVLHDDVAAAGMGSAVRVRRLNLRGVGGVIHQIDAAAARVVRGLDDKRHRKLGGGTQVFFVIGNLEEARNRYAVLLQCLPHRGFVGCLDGGVGIDADQTELFGNGGDGAHRHIAREGHHAVDAVFLCRLHDLRDVDGADDELHIRLGKADRVGIHIHRDDLQPQLLRFANGGEL